MKKFDSYKHCVINVGTQIYDQIFDNSWSFSDIKTWMFKAYNIDESSVVFIKMSSITNYKISQYG